MASAGKRAPTLYSVIAFKALKGIFFLLIALSVYSLIDNNIPDDFRHILQSLGRDPESRFWARIAGQLATITPKNILWVASGTTLYACLSLAEATGLAMRKAWGGWLAIGEGAFFIPIEIYELVVKHFRPELAAILVINVVIVLYLWFCRDRLFGHAGAASATSAPKKPKKKA